jgi:hypothetical protein
MFGIAFFASVRECRMIQHFHDSVAHLPHDDPGLTTPSDTFRADLLAFFARARRRRNGPIDHAHDSADRSHRRRFRQPITALLSKLAFDNSRVPQLNQNGFQKLARNLFPFGNFDDR